MSTNDYINQRKRALKRKYEAIHKLGGKCSVCGYNKNLAALDFHHLDPSQKLFQLDSRKFANSKLEDLELEINKCKLLCSNCHREEHNPDFELIGLESRLTDLENLKSFSSKPSGSECPFCKKRFPKMTGKIYCSRECRESDKKYPDYYEIIEKYNELKSWEKVATHFGITRKIISNIRKKHENRK